MRGSASAQVVVPFQYGGQRNTFPGLGQIEGVPGVRKDFDPEGRSALRISGRVRSQFLLQIGRGVRGWPGCIYCTLLFFSMRSAFAGMTFMLFFTTLLRTTDSDIGAT